MRVGEGRQQRQVPGIDHRGAAAGQIVQPVRIGRHRHDLRPAHAHRAVGLAGHRMDSPGPDQVVEQQRLSRLACHERCPSRDCGSCGRVRRLPAHQPVAPACHSLAVVSRLVEAWLAPPWYRARWWRTTFARRPGSVNFPGLLDGRGVVAAAGTWRVFFPAGRAHDGGEPEVRTADKDLPGGSRWDPT